jgi:hypothetical protein
MSARSYTKTRFSANDAVPGLLASTRTAYRKSWQSVSLATCLRYADTHTRHFLFQRFTFQLSVAVMLSGVWALAEATRVSGGGTVVAEPDKGGKNNSTAGENSCKQGSSACKT